MTAVGGGEPLLPLPAISVCNHLISGSLHLPLGVLCNVHSRYYCAIGLGSYLGLEVNASRLRARFPTHSTLGSQKSPRSVTSTGLSPSLVSVPRSLRVPDQRSKWAILHISCDFHHGIRFALWGVRSPLLTPYRLISFPAPTKMFQFGAFPIL